jgi:hypothetical protein
MVCTSLHIRITLPAMYFNSNGKNLRFLIAWNWYPATHPGNSGFMCIRYFACNYAYFTLTTRIGVNKSLFVACALYHVLYNLKFFMYCKTNTNVRNTYFENIRIKSILRQCNLKFEVFVARDLTRCLRLTCHVCIHKVYIKECIN